jgi:SNF2 family DNA or RNA helicase
MIPQVRAYASGGVVYVRPEKALLDYDQYVQALGPTARYLRAERAHFIPLGDVASVLGRLRAHMRVLEDPSVGLALSTGRGAAEKIAEGAETRLARSSDLYPFQAEGVRWLIAQHSALLADEMGLGKTAQILMALPAGRPALVVCPAVAIGTWVREIRKWRPDLHPVPLTRKGFYFPTAPHVGLISYDSLPPDVIVPTNLSLVADEAHALKSPKTARTKRFRAMSYRVMRTGRVWLVTGTPLLNRPQELWAVFQAAALAPKAFTDWETFVELFGGVKVPLKSLGRWAKPGRVVGSNEATILKWTIASPRVKELLPRVMLRRTRAEVLPELPTKQYASLVADLDAATVKACDALLPLLRPGEDADALLRRLSDDATFEQISALLQRLSTAKIPSLLRHVETFEESDEPLVVFSAHRSPVEALKGRKGWTTILGEDAAEVRASKVEGFQKGKYVGIAGTIGALGTSVTLTRASKVLFCSRVWTPDLNAQAEDRVCRIGQDRGVTVYDLVSDHPLDARIAEVLRDKSRLVASVLS